jgi:hypothetical protein
MIRRKYEVKSKRGKKIKFLQTKKTENVEIFEKKEKYQKP